MVESRRPSPRRESGRRRIRPPFSPVLEPAAPSALGEEDDSLFRHSAALGNQIPWSADPSGRIISIGARFRDVTGVPANGNLAGAVLAAIHPRDAVAAVPHWNAALAAGLPYEHELRLRTSEGGFRWYRVRAAPQRDQAQAVARWYGVAEDIDDCKLAEAALAWAATHDGLTRLLNRTSFLSEAARAFGAGRSGTQFVLLIADLDDFAEINGQYGPETGDRVLRQFADRLVDACGGDDLVARLDGDEFVALVRSDRVDGALEEEAETLMARLAAPLPIGCNEAVARASVGGVIFPGFGANLHDLMRAATLAMREAKQQVYRRTRLFESGMRASLQRRSSMIAVARRALREKRIVPYYQPKMSLRHGSVEGFEALLRIRGLRPAVIGPEFITAAFEDSGLAVEITDRMLDLVTCDMAKWRAQGIAFGTVAVNVAQGDLRAGDLRERILHRLDRAGLPHDCLEIEVTETVLLDHAAEGLGAALRAISAAGIRIALDDFGTGFASLTHLQLFPVDIIKIDRRFVSGLDRAPEDAAIVRAIVDLSRNLSIATVAEGVETRAQARALAAMGCGCAQGYLLAEGMPAAAVPDFLSPGAVASVGRRL